MFSSTSTQTGRISIHALREEGDLDPSQSLRGVRISIHALREEGDLPEKDRQAVRSISIHALREEGDTKSPHTSFWLSIFLSTPSARRATQKVAELTKRYNISIHALREEGDHGDLCYIMPHDNFYPRPPRGGRHTLLMVELRIKIISIHALREEGDAQIEVKVFDDFLFLSTPSARRATLPIPSNHLEGEYFYPRPPRGGRRSASSSMTASSIFLSTPSARRATLIRLRL